MLKLKIHSGFHDLFDSDMSKSTNAVVYCDWKTVIYIYVCGKSRAQFMLPMEKSVTFTGVCANDLLKIRFVKNVLIEIFVSVCIAHLH